MIDKNASVLKIMNHENHIQYETIIGDSPSDWLVGFQTLSDWLMGPFAQSDWLKVSSNTACTIQQT